MAKTNDNNILNDKIIKKYKEEMMEIYSKAKHSTNIKNRTNTKNKTFKKPPQPNSQNNVKSKPETNYKNKNKP